MTKRRDANLFEVLISQILPLGDKVHRNKMAFDEVAISPAAIIAASRTKESSRFIGAAGLSPCRM